MRRTRALIAAAGSGLLAGAVWAQGWGLVRQAPAEVEGLKNPMAGEERAQRAGAKLFARECAACHGAEADGGKGPSLRSREVREAAPGALFWVLKNGSLQKGMPSFAHLPEPQRWQIITWLQERGRGGDNELQSRRSSGERERR